MNDPMNFNNVVFFIVIWDKPKGKKRPNIIKDR